MVHLSSPQKFWEGLLRAIDRPDLAKDPRFSMRSDRMKNYYALRAVLSEIFATGSRNEWLRSLQDNDVPAGPLNSLGEVFDDPQVQHLNMKRILEHPTEGAISLVAGSYRMSATPLTIRTPAPALGQHTDDILGAIDKAAL